MKSQTSRPSFRPDKRYAGVYQQQGRVITDADWNELVEMGKERLREALEDAISGGAPRDDGFVREVNPDTGVSKLGWGRVYAEGVGAEVRADPEAGADPDSFDYTKQLDFPSPPPKDAADDTVFVDVWERHVVSPQDEWLRDPALHGADTCTRTQTLAQVKRCKGVAEFDELFKYPIGTSRLGLDLLEEVTEKNKCEPCTAEIKIERAIGNYLFRLEVHQVEGTPDSPTAVVLKWSSENGAEQYPVKETPPDFPGSWIYEFFNETSERHLGVHSPGDEGDLEVIDLVDTLTGAPGDGFVRRWDGYCRLKHGTGGWALDKGMDKGTPLDPALGGESHGFISLTALTDPSQPKLDVRLESLHLVLDLWDASFVAGDYWNAVVRERADDGTNGGEDQRVRVVSETPLGIRHHYLRIGSLNTGGDIVVPQGQPRRGLRFPPLSDLMAGDVGYGMEGACPNSLVESADDTVEKVLDKVVERLCNLAAEHVGYQPNGCENSLFGPSITTVKKALDRLCELAAKDILYHHSEGCENGWFVGSVTTVKQALDRLCKIKAADIPYEYNEELCPALKDAKNVQDAIDQLCSRPTEKAEVCAAFLALFGRGVICGLIPKIDTKAGEPRIRESPRRPDDSQPRKLEVKVAVSNGKLIDGRGCFRQLDRGLEGQRLIVDPPGSGFVIRQLKFRLLRQAIQTKVPAELRPVLDPFLTRLQQQEAQEEDLAFDTVGDFREWLKANIRMPNGRVPDDEILELFMTEILLFDEGGESVVETCLFLTVSEAGAFGLALGDCPGSPLFPVNNNKPDEFPGRYQPHLDDSMRCSEAETGVWQQYKDFYARSCLEPNDGSVCLGALHYTHSTAWLCPVGREDILFTPAIVNAMRKREGIRDATGEYWDSLRSEQYSGACGTLGAICGTNSGG